MNKVLVVVDMQNDFIRGSLPAYKGEEIIPEIINKIKETLKDDGAVIFTRDVHDANYLDTMEGKHLPIAHCIQGTDGVKLIDELVHLYNKSNSNNVRILDKYNFGTLDWDFLHELDSFKATKVLNFEKNTPIELCGVCTDICVVSNALILKAMYPENKISVIEKACAGVTKETHLAALTILKQCQVDII